MQSNCSFSTDDTLRVSPFTSTVTVSVLPSSQQPFHTARSTHHAPLLSDVFFAATTPNTTTAGVESSEGESPLTTSKRSRVGETSPDMGEEKEPQTKKAAALLLTREPVNFGNSCKKKQPPKPKQLGAANISFRCGVSPGRHHKKYHKRTIETVGSHINHSDQQDNPESSSCSSALEELESISILRKDFKDVAKGAPDIMQLLSVTEKVVSAEKPTKLREQQTLSHNQQHTCHHTVGIADHVYATQQQPTPPLSGPPKCTSSLLISTKQWTVLAEDEHDLRPSHNSDSNHHLHQQDCGIGTLHEGVFYAGGCDSDAWQHHMASDEHRLFCHASPIVGATTIPSAGGATIVAANKGETDGTKYNTSHEEDEEKPRIATNTPSISQNCPVSSFYAGLATLNQATVPSAAERFLDSIEHEMLLGSLLVADAAAAILREIDDATPMPPPTSSTSSQ